MRSSARSILVSSLNPRPQNVATPADLWEAKDRVITATMADRVSTVEVGQVGPKHFQALKRWAVEQPSPRPRIWHVRQWSPFPVAPVRRLFYFGDDQPGILAGLTAAIGGAAAVGRGSISRLRARPIPGLTQFDPPSTAIDIECSPLDEKQFRRLLKEALPNARYRVHHANGVLLAENDVFVPPWDYEPTASYPLHVVKATVGDRPLIVNDLSSKIQSCGGNIVDTKGFRVAGVFDLVLAYTAARPIDFSDLPVDLKADDVDAQFPILQVAPGSFGVQVNFDQMDDPSVNAFQMISQAAERAGVPIVRPAIRSSGTPNAGYKTFEMELTMIIGNEFAEREITETLKKMANHAPWDSAGIRVSPVSIESVSERDVYRPGLDIQE